MPASPKSENVVLQERDVRFLCGLLESRVMKLSHASAMYFDDRYEMTRKRVARLKAASLVSERERSRAYDASILCLSATGHARLTELGALDRFPKIDPEQLSRRGNVSKLTLAHELEVLDLKAALVSANRSNSSVHVHEFCTWPLLHSFEARDGSGVMRTVYPDGFLRLREQERSGEEYESLWFVELDRSTESQRTLVTKCEFYRSYYRSGDLAVRFGGTPEQFEDYYFRVLVTCRTAERRNNLAENLLRLPQPILSQVWLTTYDEFCRTPLEAIWIRPKEYRDACEGTPYAVERHSAPSLRRRPDREAFIDANVKKRSLLTPPSGY